MKTYIETIKCIGTVCTRESVCIPQSSTAPQNEFSAIVCSEMLFICNASIAIIIIIALMCALHPLWAKGKQQREAFARENAMTSLEIDFNSK